MTKTEAIDILVGVIETHSEEENEALDLAIEALKQPEIVRRKGCNYFLGAGEDTFCGLCSREDTQGVAESATTTDCISRADTIKAMCAECEMKCVCNKDCTEVAVVMGMPPVNQKQITGKLENAENATSDGEESTTGQPKSKLDCPVTHDKHTETHACDCISRQAAIEAVTKYFIDEYDKMPYEYDEEVKDNVFTDMKWVDISLEHNKGIRKVLKSLPPAQMHDKHTETHGVCSDCISREFALEVISDYVNYPTEGDKTCAIKNAPSVTPTERTTETMIVDGMEMEIDPVSYEIGYSHGQVAERTGEWMVEERDSIYGKKIRLTCSECGDVFDVTESAYPYERYCRYCGAKMKG